MSGVWSAAYCLGGFLGPSVGGFLYDQVRFRAATIPVQGLQLVSLAFVLLCGRGSGTVIFSDRREIAMSE